MDSNFIKINEVSLKQMAGVPIVFHGKHSGKDLAGINLDFYIQGQKYIEEIEELFEQEKVNVFDPFTNRSYVASIHMLSCSYSDEDRPSHYTAEIREIDITPEFNILEIEGHQFHVIKYKETDASEDDYEDAIGRHALLHLSREEFDTLNKLVENKVVSIKRIDVDEESFKVRFGGTMYWSEHEEEKEIYFKRIVRLYPPDLPGERSSFLQQVSINEGLLLDLIVVFEALLDELVKNGVITENKKADLLTNKYKDLIGEKRLDELILKFSHVSDASEEFG